jgi:hypothetical protein
MIGSSYCKLEKLVARDSPGTKVRHLDKIYSYASTLWLTDRP